MPNWIFRRVRHFLFSRVARVVVQRTRDGAVRAAKLSAFIVGLVATASAIGTRLPMREVPEVSEKLHYIEMHGDEFNVYFIGSSRVYHQIIPELFDRLMEEAGIQTRSFNLGVDGMRPPEDGFLLERALRDRHKALRWVIVESNSIRFPIEKNFSDSVRGVYWRDVPRMRWLLKRLLVGKAPDQKNFAQRAGEILHESEDMWGHCCLWFPNATHLGEGATILFQEAGLSSHRNLSEKLGPRQDGFLSPGDVPMSTEILRDYMADMARLHRKPAEVDYADPTSRELVQWMNQTVANAGGELMLIVPPTTNNSKFYPDPKGDFIPSVIDFSDPHEYPALFAYENRKDTCHLNQSGAECLTRLLAARMIASQSSGQDRLTRRSSWRKSSSDWTAIARP